MATAAVEQPPMSENEKVEAWRLRALIQAGYPAADADPIANRLDIDLHLACQLVKNGCSPSTALRILL